MKTNTAFAIMMSALAAALCSGCQLEETDMVPSSGYCQPDVDSFQLDYPWFPLNNPPPQKLTAAGLLRQLNDTAIAKGWTPSNNLTGLFDLNCARAYSFCPKGKFDSIQFQSWNTMSLLQMVWEINRVDSEESIGYYSGNKFDRWLTSSGAAGGQTVLDYLESMGFSRNIMNWWMIQPNTPNQTVQAFLDSLVPPVSDKAPKIACGGITKFNNMLLTAHYPGVYATDLNFGEDVLTHTVSLWHINNFVFYYDALNGLTLAKPNGDTIDFRRAFGHIYYGRYDSVEFRKIPEYFGTDYEMMSTDTLRMHITGMNLDYARFVQVWQTFNFSHPFDSSWFCRQ